ncbi:MAG: 5'-nucleotidase C-terminal domain-containing protein [Bacteroidaceae bacterium]|nr:5'-nucleotidase C-terminal domain-containing protein [Bacteroidaceae bacterium]
MKQFILYTLATTCLLMSIACTHEQKCNLIIEGRNILVAALENEQGAEKVRAIINKGQKLIDSIKAPIIGTASMTLTVNTPESTLMNFAADALLTEARRHSSQKIDIAVTNKGGLRNDIHKGNITFGDIYNVFPFENTLTLLTLNGEQLRQLFSEIAAEGGEAISGARLTISPDGELISATVDGKPINPSANYRIATSDYLSQGNDGLHTLAKGSEKENLGVTIRDIMINHIAQLHSNGVSVSATTDGRITITENR